MNRPSEASERENVSPDLTTASSLCFTQVCKKILAALTKVNMGWFLNRALKEDSLIAPFPDLSVDSPLSRTRRTAFGSQAADDTK